MMMGFRKMGSTILFLAAMGLVLWALPGVRAGDEAKSAEPAHDYVGAAKCKICHKGAKKGEIYEKWETSPHAKAYEVLPEASQKDEACLACHTTGYGAGGFAVGDEDAAKFANVGCEACHGPGSDYKSMKVMKDRELALKAGMIIPTAEECAACHTGEMPKACWGGAEAAPGFDFAEAWKVIEHAVPEE
jgi:hypothetical protein